MSLLLAAAILLAACEPKASPAPSSAPVIVASTSILADIARNVAGDRLEVASLLPLGADPHEFQSTPAGVQRIAGSRAIVINGLDYEGFIQPLLESAGGEHRIITASEGLPLLKMDGGTGGGAPDPHMWLDPARVIGYVENIRDGLAELDPEGAAIYEANAQATINRLRELDSWISQQVETIPSGRRLLVTNHEALGYFADHYGFSVIGTIIPSVSTAAGTSARELVAVIDGIKAAGAPAIFVGRLENADLARQISAETGAVVVDDLYLESLTDGPPAATYLDMMRHNVQRIVDALK
jgi:ABC-type Zn uptake system ZnuABC Zn-binding protein ZnuA